MFQRWSRGKKKTYTEINIRPPYPSQPMPITRHIHHPRLPRRQNLFHDQVRQQEMPNMPRRKLRLDAILRHHKLHSHDPRVIHHDIHARHVPHELTTPAARLTEERDAKSTTRARVSTSGCTAVMASAVWASLAASRPARMRRRGAAAATACTKTWPRLPGETPVVRMALLAMMGA